MIVAVVLMAGAIVGLVIASNEITKENHTQENTLVSKDKGEVVPAHACHGCPIS